MKINCKIHAKEMQLLGLRRQLEDPAIDSREKETLMKEIAKLEKDLGLEDFRSSHGEG